MKHIALVVLCSFLTVTSIRADDKPPDDFADIKWGESADGAKATMLLKPDVKFINASPDGANLFFEGGTFATLPATKWEFTFATAKFIKGRVDLAPSDSSVAGLREAYDTLKKSITEKYKKAGREEHDRGSHSATYWTFQTRKGSWQIACDVDPRRKGIRLTYSFNPPLKPAKQGNSEQKKDL
ncbi:MAG TPA: hypothetical protein VF593_14060 [Chthoniobacteraceae bacterium]|jgi:hypothetical protein